MHFDYYSVISYKMVERYKAIKYVRIHLADVLSGRLLF